MGPSTGSHMSTVQALPSSMMGGMPGIQMLPAAQISTPLQRFPSEQLAPTGSGSCCGPPVGVHESAVQGLPSSRTGGVPGRHAPVLSQTSLPLQRLPSGQAVPADKGVCTAPVAGSHESVVQGLPSSTPSGGPPTHVPFAHRSAVVHALPSLHEVPFGAFKSPGQLAETPLQVSAGSQVPVDARQIVPALPAECWHVRLEPLHLSVVQALPSSVHAVPFALGEHVPASPVKLHAPHSPVHAVSQHTPLAQKPVAH
jgi:hypothetical protein